MIIIVMVFRYNSVQLPSRHDGHVGGYIYSLHTTRLLNVTFPDKVRQFYPRWGPKVSAMTQQRAACKQREGFVHCGDGVGRVYTT